MDPMQIIILTAVVNFLITGILGGIVIYVLQRRIDARIQKSLFEHQTKFSRNREKTVETLETLYKKLVAYAQGFGNITLDARVYCYSITQEIDNVDARLEELDERLKDYQAFLEEHRLFLSTLMFIDITLVHTSAVNLFFTLRALLRLENPMQEVRDLLSKRDTYNEIDWDKVDCASILHAMSVDLMLEVDKLRMLYLSVSAVKPLDLP